jgi:hypothetical protein
MALPLEQEISLLPLFLCTQPYLDSFFCGQSNASPQMRPLSDWSNSCCLSSTGMEALFGVVRKSLNLCHPF